MTVKTTIAVIAVAAALVTVNGRSARYDEWPPVHGTRCAWDVWPELDLARIEVGHYYEWQVRDTFGARFVRPATWGSRCIAFAYDEDLVSDPPLFLALVVDDGIVQGKWLAKAPFLRRECAGHVQEVVELKGHFQAGGCW